MTDEPNQLMRIEKEVAYLVERATATEQRIEEVAEAPVDTEEIDLILNTHEARLNEFERRIQSLEAHLAAKELELRTLMDRTEGAVMIDHSVMVKALASELVKRMTKVRTVKAPRKTFVIPVEGGGDAV